MFFVLLCATISVFGQVSLIEGKWEDVKPLPKPETVRSATFGVPLNDPLFEYQKGLFRQIGLTDLMREYGVGVLNQPVDVPVVLIDTGVSYLKDTEGRIDSARSRTFAIDGGDPSQDDGPHGTPVSSIGFATANNGIGLAGINSSSTIIPVKAVGAYTNQFGQKVLRRDDMKGLIESFKYVLGLLEEFPLIVVNTSLAVDGIPPELQEVLDAIKKTDKVLLVTPADNFPEDLAKLKKSLCVDEPNVLCVSSISGEEGQTYLSAWSAYGAQVSYTGRCHDIVAQYSDDRYGRFTGNSGCAPQVSAAASLVASYMASKGRILKASELKNLMLRGGEFDPGLISGTRPIRYPITLNMLRLFREVDSVLKNPESNLRSLSIVLQANSLKGEDGKPLREIERGVSYRVEGAGFGENTTVFLNRIPLETVVLSPNTLEFRVGDESSLASGEKVIYIANRGSDGNINPLEVVSVLFGFSIR
jgi:hypothetical protein